MQSLPTLFYDRQELLLDLDIYGKIISTPQTSREELTQILFEEFNFSHPAPTLEDERYKLSDLVSEDYRVEYEKSLKLHENEQLMALRGNAEKKCEDLSKIEVPKELQALFSYGKPVDKDYKMSLLEKFALFDDEEGFTRGIASTTKLYGSVTEDKAAVLTDEEIDELGRTKAVDVQAIDEEYSDDEPDADEEFYEETSEDEEESYEEPEESYEEPEESSEGEEESYECEEESYEEPEDEDISSDDYDYEEEKEEVEESTESDEDVDDSYGDDDDYGDDYWDDEGSDEPAEEDEVDDEDEVYDISDDNPDPPPQQEGTKQIIEPDLDFEPEEPIKPPKKFSFAEEIRKQEELSKPAKADDLGFTQPPEKPKPPVVNGMFNPNSDDDDEDLNLSSFDVKPAEPVPKTPTSLEFGDNEPTDLRAFLKKHPRCEMSVVLRYFSKKEVETQIRLGKVIKRGTTLRI